MDLSSYLTALSARVPHAKNEYKGDDGLLHCGVCNGKVQTVVNILGEERVVRCVCDCIVKEREQYNEKQRAEEIERRRRVCFGKASMAQSTFANDNRENEKLSDAMKRYADQFPEFLEEGRGLLLVGPVGTGKSFLAACIANKLLDDGYYCLMTNFTTLINRIQETFDERQAVIDDLNNYSLLILDDLGAERQSEFMQEQVYNIIDARYRSGLPFIITTNISLEEIKKPKDISYARIYDRILERCFPVVVDGVSKRRQAVKASYEETKRKLGL